MEETTRRRRSLRHRVFQVLGGLCLLLAVPFAGMLIWAMATAPSLDVVSVSPRGYRSSVLDDRGEEILTLAGEEANRVYVTLDEIPEDLQNAFIAIEDARFWKHKGIDLRGVLRAVVQNLKDGKLSQGASTLTQQLIKNNVYAAGMEEHTALDRVRRKLQELVLAVELEQRESKAWILENYLNTINLGGGAWGVQAAAQRYFGRDVGELTLPECAAIAAIAKSPSGYNPLRNPEKNRDRARLVLSRMEELGLISEERYAGAAAEDIYTALAESASGTEIRPFTWFEDAAVSQVAEDLQSRLGYSEADAWRLLYRGGLTIETTQDTALQRLCEAAVNGADTDAQLTVVVMDPSDGAVKAIVGGRGEKTASLTWNRAASSPRQPGSTLKVLGEYAAALETGSAALATVWDDAPTAYTDGTPIRNAGGAYRGRTSMRKAIADSLNTVALRCFQQVGMDSVWRQLGRYGFDHLDERDKVEALALGGTRNGVTNLELTAAYAAIAGGGAYREPRYYTRILDRSGKVLLAAETGAREAMRPYTAALLTSAMEDVLTDGTGKDAAFPGQSLAGKSGTTSDRRDLWFVGFSPYLVCGVWGGYDDNAPQTVNAPVKSVWKQVMREAHADLPPRTFAQPSGMEKRTVCAKCGRLAVDGLCGETVQGDMVREEWFAPGTAPVLRCQCHVRVELCAVSGQRAGLYCRARTGQVYLAEGTPGTADADAVCPVTESCTVHRRWWDWLAPVDRNTVDAPRAESADENSAVEEPEEPPEEPPEIMEPEEPSGAVEPPETIAPEETEPPETIVPEELPERTEPEDDGPEWWTISEVLRLVEWLRED